MKLCSKCGVQLDDDMRTCPLCETPLAEGLNPPKIGDTENTKPFNDERKGVMQRILWQITMVLLVSGIFATLLINLSIIGELTWAIYPITICLILLGYASLMALRRIRLILRILGGWSISVLQLLVINRFTQTDWPIMLVIPLVSSVNIVGILLALVLMKVKTKGLNVLAIVIVAIAVLALMVESVISWYVNGSIILGWSIIVAACLLPVTTAILFMYFKTKNNSELQKIFHT